MKFCQRFISFVFVLALAAGCSPQASPQPTSTPAPSEAATSAATTVPAAAQELTVMTHDSFAVTDTLIHQFEQDHHAKITFIKSGDAGAALNRAILSKNSPMADVFYGVDNTFLSRALDAGIFEEYASPRLADIPAQYQLDPSNHALPVDYGDVCINYDKAYFQEKNLAVPQSLEDLAKLDYKGLLVTENPSTSSTGLAFLLATIAHFGDGGYLDYWKSLSANGVVVVNGWETAYYTNFSGSSGKGAQPMVVSYASSPAAEVVFATSKPADSPTASILAPDTCFRQMEFVGILTGAKNRALAEQFVDFMLDVSFQEDMPMQMFVYPVNDKAKLPDEFVKYAQVAQKPATLSPADISANRDKWIQEWTGVVLR